MISAVLISYNEKAKLKVCLESLEGFTGEIIVVDLGSSDGTKEMLEDKDVKLFKHDWVPYADPIRNYAFSKASGDWIIMLDPDERLTSSLKDELLEISKGSSEYTAVNIPFKNIFWGRWIAHTNFWPDKHIRFFKKGTVKWQEKVHSYPIIDGLVLDLPSDEKYAIEHFGYDNYRQFIRKQWKYSTSAAWNRLSEGKGFSLIELMWQPLREFLARFIKHQGYKDGLDGVFLVGVLMVYQIVVQLKVLLFSFSREARKY